MNKKPVISVIVPVYGVEKYIFKCIESIKEQIFKDFEVLIVNDGTKDDSISVALKAIAGDVRFKVLHKKNGGQGSARNLGLDQAAGDYISFIDSDDYVEPGFLEDMYRKIVEDGADICTCDVVLVDILGNKLKEFRSDSSRFLEEEDVLNFHYYISNWMPDKLFHRSVFSSLRFDEGLKTYEDSHLIFRLLYNKKITSVSKVLYNYVQHQASTVHGVNPTYLKDRVSVKDKQMEFLHKIGFEDDEYWARVYLKTFVYYCALKFSRSSDNYTHDMTLLYKEIDFNVFNYKRILLMLAEEKKMFLLLLVLRSSPVLFKALIRVWDRLNSRQRKII